MLYSSYTTYCGKYVLKYAYIVHIVITKVKGNLLFYCAIFSCDCINIYYIGIIWFQESVALYTL